MLDGWIRGLRGFSRKAHAKNPSRRHDGLRFLHRKKPGDPHGQPDSEQNNLSVVYLKNKTNQPKKAMFNRKKGFWGGER